ncbi:RNA polymerase sigma-70 factor [Longitalea luteola]|uniref:RNA polymerase sigma-70 factor n=1 Tax=Longitalea luteola TaxID=2812563 RepID=UPI001A962D0F|nr:RNA polymerase sigma-70 factor [Longitalea luteola]
MKNPGHHIIAGFQQGSKEAFAAVYHMHYSRLYGFIKKLIDDREEAQDITAETFVKLWKLHANFATQENIKAFLYITARNACMDYLRYRQRQTANQQEFGYVLGQLEEQMPTANDEIKTEVLKQIHLEIEQLPTQCKRIFKMAWLEGKKNAAIAMELALTEQTVRNQKARAVKILRVALANYNMELFVLFILYML